MKPLPYRVIAAMVANWTRTEDPDMEDNIRVAVSRARHGGMWRSVYSDTVWLLMQHAMPEWRERRLYCLAIMERVKEIYPPVDTRNKLE